MGEEGGQMGIVELEGSLALGWSLDWLWSSLEEDQLVGYNNKLAKK